VRPARMLTIRRAVFAAALVAGVVAIAVAPAMRAQAPAAAALTNAPAPDPALIQDLVAANHILANEEVVDGYGHVSVRHPNNPNRYLLARSMAPELVTADDILELDLDSTVIDARKRTTYIERFIHGAIYKARPDVMAIVHMHAPAVIPFGVTGVQLRPIFHMSAFIGLGVPLFEIRDAAGMTDMLISNNMLGNALAKTLADKPAALMRGHGAVVVATTLPVAVGRAVYLKVNAEMQTQATILGGGKINFLTPEESKLTVVDNYVRAWDLWKRKAMK
jgi:ribulose-5-phosphate 4-epimerase/fuculose-1-phosphate aldolase